MGSSECPAKVAAQFMPPPKKQSVKRHAYGEKCSSVLSAEQNKQSVTAAPDRVQHVNDDAAADRSHIAPLV